MARMTRWCLVFALAGAVSTAGASTCDRLEAATWLLGEWTAQDGDNVVLESWRRVSPDTFEGLGETRTGPDGTIVAAEALRLVSMADDGLMTVEGSDGSGKGFTLRFHRREERQP